MGDDVLPEGHMVGSACDRGSCVIGWEDQSGDVGELEAVESGRWWSGFGAVYFTVDYLIERDSYVRGLGIMSEKYVQVCITEVVKGVGMYVKWISSRCSKI